MSALETVRLGDVVAERAPDGSRVYPLLSLDSGGMAQFELDAGSVSCAVVHRKVDEIWMVTAGRGEIWRQSGDRQTTDRLEKGVCVAIPAGTAFQFRCSGDESLHIVAVTIPPWPGEHEAMLVPGKWSD